MSAHTPGPWVAVGENSRLEFVQKDIGGTHMTIATCFQQGGMRQGERTANAMLIASAPDLVDALLAVLGSPVRSNGIHDGTGRTVSEVILSALKKAGVEP